MRDSIKVIPLKLWDQLIDFDLSQRIVWHLKRGLMLKGAFLEA